MSKLERFGISVDDGLLRKFDHFIRERSYRNRSEAIRDLMRAALVSEEWSKKEIIAGGIAYVYNHHKRQLANQLLDIQHGFHDLIISAQHVHLDHENCFEIIIVKGKVESVSSLYDQLRALKGVKFIDIIRATTGKLLT
ncbi:MAG: nickel-responsive transcriptional regulator NikR [Fidelibacterota bacterium]|nr:MAG: nickel-responsive transcriptional regulator NikR [Candidatus Neomarinimicrobiota bacterium]